MWLNKITKPGRYFLAIPMVVFGIQHFLYAQFVVQMVPSWIPAPFFWTYFAGVALFAAGLGIILNICSGLAATLLGLMISTWVITLHIPRALATAGDREFINIFDALFILSGAFLLSADSPDKRHLSKISTVGANVGQFLIAISIVIFGIMHFMKGKLVFIVGAEYHQVPGTTFWVYLTGLLFIVSALGIVFTKRAALIALLLGVYIFFITLLFYGPQLWSNLYDGHTWATFLKGIAMSGSALILASWVSRQEIRVIK